MTGTPGSRKTAYVVSLLDKVETENKINLVKNVSIYQHNLELINKHNLQSDLTYYVRETGTGDTLKQQIELLDDDYYHFILQEFDELRPEFYFARTMQFNEMLNRIVEREGDYGFKYLLPVRTIYTNINALKIDYVRANQLDWRKCPDGSIVVIDEIQLVKPFDDEKSRGNPIIEDLSVHRHRGFDFYVITQQPIKLHATIRGLVHLHWHATTPFGWYTRIYQYGQYEQSPNAVRVRLGAERSFKFNPPDRIFKLYKSTTIDTSQKRIPWRLLLFLGAIMAVGFSMLASAFFLATDEPSETKAPASAPASTTATTINPFNMDIMGYKSNASATDSTMLASAPAVDYTQLQAKADYEYQQMLLNTPVNVIAIGDKCTAYNKDGMYLAISKLDCLKYAHGDKKTLKVSQVNQSMQAVTMPQPPIQQQPVPQQPLTTANTQIAVASNPFM
ncbi:MULTISPECIES: zonular occludens toxin domain-containing protein [unclassified Moraxella]|uniref:zonular occludens toxin domain-containing protein n=1 Tax=unclassified Moraxella TaxID=2685852 RepID=UPI003AF91B5E